MTNGSSQHRKRALNKAEWIYKNVNGLPLVFSPALSRLSFLTHAFTTRLGGETLPPMESFNLGRLSSMECREDLLKNRAKLCTALGLDNQQLLVPDMTHSNTVVFVQETNPRPTADGIATDKSGLPMMVTYADCAPIFIVDTVKRIHAVVHAGWRGTASGIVVEAVNLLREQCGSSVNDLVAAIGPTIGSCCYPTGNEPIAKLLQSIAEADDIAIDGDQELAQRLLCDKIQQNGLSDFFLLRNGQFHPDLKAINALQLLRSGLSVVDITNLCTACNPKLFYSHRQSGGTAGRQGAVACLN